MVMFKCHVSFLEGEQGTSNKQTARPDKFWNLSMLRGDIFFTSS